MNELSDYRRMVEKPMIEGYEQQIDQLSKLAEKLLWRPVATAPKDEFVILWCPEDQSRWWAKWQGDEWYGVDELGLTRTGHSIGDDAVTGWIITAWMPMPEPPAKIEEK